MSETCLNPVAAQGIITVERPRRRLQPPRGMAELTRSSTVTDPTWLPIPGAAHYEASSDGQIRSIDRKVPHRGRLSNLRGKVLKQFANPGDGYMQVIITLDSGKRRGFHTHRLVCLTFHGEPKVGEEVCHNNGIRTDNRAENLRWGTKSENQYDRVRHGNHYQANKTHCYRGHPFDEDNTLHASRGDGTTYRKCRTCADERKSKWNAENPESLREHRRKTDQKRGSDPEKRKKRSQASLDWYHANREAILARRAELRAKRRSG